MTKLNPQDQLLQKLVKDRNIRVAVTRQSHFWFSSVYLADYVKYETADFQKEMFGITEDQRIRMAVIVAFRGSAKSTIMTLSYPLWAITGVQQKKFVLILSQTQAQARSHLSNIRKKLEENNPLKKEMGPFEEKHNEWGATSIVIPKYDARITAASSEQSIRGIRHGSHRPDLIICDDIEDIASVKTLEGRDKTYNWFNSEVVPIGDSNTKIIVVGNLLHEDSLLMRLREGIESQKLDGIFRKYPLVNDGTILWPGKFKSMADIDKEKKTVLYENAWQREFLLNIVPEDDQLIFSEHLHYYDELPEEKPRHVVTAVDLAISLESSADYTAMVSAYIYGSSDNLRIYLLPNPVNERLDFSGTIERIKSIHGVFSGMGLSSHIYVEEVGYQGVVVEHLKSFGIKAEGVKPHGKDKRSRLALTTHLIQSGKILFPRRGADALIAQLVGFGKEKHDDLADGFSMLTTKTIERDRFATAGVLIAGPFGM